MEGAPCVGGVRIDCKAQYELERGNPDGKKCAFVLLILAILFSQRRERGKIVIKEIPCSQRHLLPAACRRFLLLEDPAARLLRHQRAASEVGEVGAIGGVDLSGASHNHEGGGARVM